jgi:hypothetical protein
MLGLVLVRLGWVRLRYTLLIVAGFLRYRKTSELRIKLIGPTHKIVPYVWK